MRAMTEIPAKTPKPIGRTEIFFPGSANGASLGSADSAAAEVPPTSVVAGGEGSVPRLSAGVGCC